MMRRLAAFGAAVSLVAFGCRAIPAPQDGVLSLSSVQLPSPGVVAGATMRDSAGHAAPLRLYAFGVGGQADTIADAVPPFILLDAGAHVSPDGYLIGDSVRATPVRIIGSVGTLQTSFVNVDVTPLPDSMGYTSTTPIDTVRFIGADTAASANFSAALGATVVATGTATNSPVSSVIVHYAIVYAPTPVGNGVAGLLVDPAGHPSSVDTTDASGQVSRRIRVRPSAPVSVDSFVVTATAEYKGVMLRGSALRFVIPIHNALATSSRGN